MIKFHDVEQNTPEWFDLRCGRVGGSSIGTIMARLGSPFGEPAKRLAADIALEQVTGIKIKSELKSKHLDRGHEQEPFAKAAYEAKKGFITVKNGGYFAGAGIGMSPDGLSGKYGSVEIKCHLPSIHFINIQRGTFNPDYLWQYLFNLKVTGRRWIDTISFCEKFPINTQLCIYRIEAKDCKAEFKEIDGRLTEFFELVNESKKIIMGQ